MTLGIAYGDGGRVQPAPRDEFEELLGPDLLYGWHCSGVSPSDLSAGKVATVRDRYRGLQLGTGGVAKPTFVSDGSNFHGRNVFGIGAAVGGGYLWASQAANLVVNGSRPMIVLRYRMTNAPVASTSAVLTLIGLGVVGSSDTYRIGAMGTGTTCPGPGFASGGTTYLVTGPVPNADTSTQHTAAIWLDGTNANIRVDGTLYSAANASTIGAVTAVAMGRCASGNYHQGDGYVACALILRAYPGVTKETALRNLISNIY